MNAIDLLIADHEKVSALFDEVKATEDEEKHKQLFEQISAELKTHTHIEETIFYPALKNYEELKDMVLEAFEEHKQVRTLIREIENLTDGSEKLDAKLKVVIDNVEHHIEEEENEMFPKVEQLFSEAELEDLGDQMDVEKKSFQKNLKAAA